MLPSTAVDEENVGLLNIGPTAKNKTRAPGNPFTVTHQDYMRIKRVIGAYWFVSILTVFVNEKLLRDFDAPIFLTWFQCVFAVLFYVAIKYLRRRTTYFSTLIPDITFQWKILCQTLPLSIVFVAMLTLNNLCLKYLDLSSYYLTRSLTPITTVILTLTLLNKNISGCVICCCGIMTAAYFFGMDAHDGLTPSGTQSREVWKGFTYGIFSSYFVSLYGILTQKYLSAVDDCVWTLCFYTNLNAGMLINIISLIFWPNTWHELSTNVEVDDNFWILMTIGGFCGILIGILTALQIKLTSPLTHNVSGTTKACAHTIVTVLLNNAIKSWPWWISNYVVLIGSLMYAKFRQGKMKPTR